MGAAILDDEFSVSEETIICAFEYALGRLSYVVANVVRDISENAELLSSDTRQKMIKKIADRWQVGALGSPTDRQLWVKLLDQLEEIESESQV